LLRLLAITSVMLWGGCNIQRPLQEQDIGALGSFEFRQPIAGMDGVIIGAPHGLGDPDSVDYAKSISEQIGAGLVIASGFASKRLAITQPLIRSTSAAIISDDPRGRGSIYREFKTLLKQTADGPLRLYIGMRFAPQSSDLSQIEVATSGFTFEELEFLKESFIRIRDQALSESPIPKPSIAVDPLDKISWRISGVKHHGVLMFVERGLSLRLPKSLSNPAAKSIYTRIFSSWITESLKLLESHSPAVARSLVRLMDYGRIESIPSRKRVNGVVIGAPHGTFDEHTAELVNRLSYRTGLAAVIASGFTPTECAGWRINVNRPTERLYPSDGFEIQSDRAKNVYYNFKEAVLEASRDDLKLYVDIHQNGRQAKIEVATVGITKQEAQFIKRTYRQLRDRVLASNLGVTFVDLLIEPLDEIEIGMRKRRAC
jgi:hypothetical protein